MTNLEAIRLIRNLPTMCEFTDAYGEPIDSDAYYEAVDMAISALKAQEAKTQLSAEGTTSDLISRQAAIDEIKALYEWHDTVTEDRTIDHLKKLPSAQPETCEDAVSREAAIDVAENAFVRGLLASPDIRRLPPAQPEIIRCKDCRWRKDQSGSTAWLPCRAIVTPSDFYCGRAERRTDDL